MKSFKLHFKLNYLEYITTVAIILVFIISGLILIQHNSSNNGLVIIITGLFLCIIPFSIYRNESDSVFRIVNDIYHQFYSHSLMN